MARRRGPRNEYRRLELANEAARIMREQGVKDYLVAKRKAADRLGVKDRGALPGNDEIAAALREQQRLFGGAGYESRLRLLRQTAARAMRLLEDFEPRLVGALLSGTITEHTDVSLHVFADAAEAVAMRLIERDIPYEITEKRVRYPGEKAEAVPAYRFMAGEVVVEAAVFPQHSLRQAPTCPVEGRPMRRLRLTELADLNPD